jgi:hypothetical protein
MTDERGKKRGNGKGSPDFPKGDKDVAVTVAPQTGIAATVKSSSDLLVDATLANPRHELYAQAVAAGTSYIDACRQAGYTADHGNAWRLAANPLVSARVRMLMRAAAERRVSSIASRMALLDDIAHTPASEVVRVVSVPCPACWSDQAIAAHMSAAAAGNADTPNLEAAQPDCKACRGLHRVYDITPTDQLSAAGRAIFRGVKLTANGIEPVLADRQAAIAELNKMQDGALAASRSLNANLNINGMIPAARDVSVEELSRLLEAFDEPR